MKLIILDRDGVINYDSDDYIKSPEEWIPIPGSIEAVAKLSQAGYTLVIATNQSGVSRQLYSLDTLEKIHEKMQSIISEAGGTISKIFFCPHHPDEKCGCRKPQPGLLLQIAEHFKIDLKGVPFVGDSVRDIEAAQAVGCQPVLLKTGNGQSALAKGFDVTHIPVYNDLQEAVEDLLKKGKWV